MLKSAYEIAIQCLEYGEKHEPHDPFLVNLRKALNLFAVSIAKYGKTKDLTHALRDEFDIDSIIEFSDAWGYWEDMHDILFKGKSPKPALDQLLFAGKHSKSKSYFKGIESLAQLNAEKVSNLLSCLLPEDHDRKMLDLGAGPGVYSRAFINKGIISESLALDFQFVIDEYKASDDKITWLGADIINPAIKYDRTFGLVYLANILHHYDSERVEQMFFNASHAIDSGGYIVIQDYIACTPPVFSPVYATILGVHFALTTEGGRCYTSNEIQYMVQKNISDLKFKAHINVGETDLMIFQRA